MRIWKKVLSVVLVVVMLAVSVPVANYTDVGVGLKVAALGDVFEYGEYPQSLVTDGELVAILNTLNATNNDVEYNGNKYRKYSGGYYLYEPITWSVVSSNDESVCLISNCVLDSRPFNSKSYWQSGCTWETCSLRSWLNSTFYNTAFSEDEKVSILTTTISTPSHPNYTSIVTKDTTDKIFVPSLGEMQSLSDDLSRVAALTDYSLKVAMNCKTEPLNGMYNANSTSGVYWLRTMGRDPRGACVVYPNGNLKPNFEGKFYGNHDDRVGVRPAFCLDIDAYKEHQSGTVSGTFGWCIPNTNAAFSYSDDYQIPLSYYYTNGASISSIVNGVASRFGSWGGNCFGLSLLALADYNGQIDLETYFNNSGEALNRFGYETIEYCVLGDHIGNIYTLTGNVEIIKAIEKAQVSQYSSDVEKTEILGIGSTMSDFVEYCKSSEGNPLLIAMIPIGHAVTVDPTRKVEQKENGIYIVWLYDSNAPRDNGDLVGAMDIYDYQQSYLAIDTENDKWAYCYNDKISPWYSRYSIFDSSLGYKTIKFYDVSKLSNEFFYGDLNLIKDAIILSSPSTPALFKVYNSFDTLFELTYGDYIIKSNDINYTPYFENLIDNGDYTKGCLTLPNGEYTFELDGDISFMRLVGEDYIVAYNSSDAITIEFDDAEHSMKIISDSANTANFEIAIQNTEYDTCEVVSGAISPKKDVTIDYTVVDGQLTGEIISSTALSKIESKFVKGDTVIEEEYHRCAYEDIDHTDYDHNGKCDICLEVLEAVKNCTCMCHKSGFMALVYAFVNLFWRIFGTHKSCECGVWHW